MQLMKTLVITLITALCALFFMRAAPAEVVSIWDEDLRAAILKKLNKPNPKAAITTSDMLRLTELRVEEVGYSTLTGLEHATNLKTLYLSWDTAVHPRVRGSYTLDVSPLTNLTHLKILVLEGTVTSKMCRHSQPWHNSWNCDLAGNRIS